MDKQVIKNSAMGLSENWRKYQNYIIIALLSIFAVFVIPFLGTEVGLAFVLPTTTAGWIVFVVSKLTVAGLNMALLHFFVIQGKVNVRNHPQFLEAQRLLRELPFDKVEQPQSPSAHLASVYGGKGITLFITSVLSTFTFTQAILTFEVITFITYLLTVAMGVIFGIYQMTLEEIYWTEDYWRYAQITHAKQLNQNTAQQNVQPEGENNDKTT